MPPSFKIDAMFCHTTPACSAIVLGTLPSLRVGTTPEVTTYVVNSPNSAELEQNLKSVMAARDAALSGHRAASTLVTVPALAKPEWLMEISVLAAKRPNS